MNLYLDASALAKQYLIEPGTPETRRAVSEATVVATTVTSRAEVAAVFAKAVRMNAAGRNEIGTGLESFRNDWPDLFSINVGSSIATHAERLAWEEDLRGYDAVQLASAQTWKKGIGEDVIFATFDLELWKAAGRHQFVCFPDNLPALLDDWKQG